MKSISATRAALVKQFGSDVLATPDPTRGRSTGIAALDTALNIGGLPEGRIIEVFGPESSGKTTLALSCIAAAQRRGETCAYIDAEHALDLRYASSLGVDSSRLLVSQPDSGPQGLEICDALARSGAVDLIIVDSTAALVTRPELEGNMDDSNCALAERLMSTALRKLCAICARNGTTLMFISQLRPKYGITFGSPEESTGENALRYFASVRIDLRRIGSVVDTVPQDASPLQTIGQRTRAKVVKSKVAAPFTECEFKIIYGQGIVPG